jgi:N-acyl amino acid synthase of PEP-CTERM/exosortase system
MTTGFRALTLDDSPRLLEESYRLRYQVYCLERMFLPAQDYPNHLEIDDFDGHATHVGVVDADEALAGTARLIAFGPAGLPILRYCTISPEARTVIDNAGNTVAEVSRLSISRRYRRRQGDGPFGAEDILGADGIAVPRLDRRQGRGDVFVTLVKAIYQAAKRNGVTHWLVATETSLQRLIVHLGLPFKLVGPEADYGGPVAPYIMSLAEFDRVILDGRLPALDGFLVGLEPAFVPLAVERSECG